jgi:CheY-like chemotaxis protein
VWHRTEADDLQVMDGFTATSKIRDFENEEDLPRCAIVALTGVTSAEATERAHACGVDRYFTKPIRMNTLKELWGEIARPQGLEDQGA